MAIPKAAATGTYFLTAVGLQVRDMFMTLDPGKETLPGLITATFSC